MLKQLRLSSIVVCGISRSRFEIAKSDKMFLRPAQPEQSFKIRNAVGTEPTKNLNVGESVSLHERLESSFGAEK